MASSMQELFALLKGGPDAVEELRSGPRTQEADTSFERMGQQALTPDGDHIASILMDRLDNPAQVAGIMGNIQKEAGKDFDYTQKQLGNGPGRGLFQMEGEMLKAYNSYLTKKELNDSPYSQIDFMVSTLRSDDDYKIGAGHRTHLNESAGKNDPEDYALEFSNRFERPKAESANNEGRQAAAREWYNRLTKDGK